MARRRMEDKVGEQVQGDIPITQRPYGQIGEEIGLTEQEVIEDIRNHLAKGTIRKFGAILRHRQAGYSRNAMVIWAVAAERAEEVGKILSAFKEVTHCYRRAPAFEGKYSLFTMIHFQDREIDDQIARLARAAGVEDYRILESLEEYKKSSMEYF